MFLIIYFSVGRVHVDKSVPKMTDTERKMSREFQGWVNKGGQWKPTECKARVKVSCKHNDLRDTVTIFRMILELSTD